MENKKKRMWERMEELEKENNEYRLYLDYVLLYLNKIVRNTGQEPVCIAYGTSDAMGTISGLLKKLDCKLNGVKQGYV